MATYAQAGSTAGSDQPAPGEPPYPRAAYAWYVVLVLSLAYTFSFVDRQILTLLVAPIRRDLGLTNTEITLLQGIAFAIFYTFMGFPVGRMVDRSSRRTIIAIGIVVWSLATAACGLATNFWELFVARIFVGVGEAALGPAAFSLIADYFPPRRRGAALGFYGVGIYVGAGLAFVIGGLVAQQLSGVEMIVVPVLGEMHQWSLVFFVVGLPGVLVAALIFTIREPFRREVKTGLRADGTHGAVHATVGDLVAFLKGNWKTFACHNIGFGLLAMTSYGAGFWIPNYLMWNLGWDQAQAGGYYGLLVILFGTPGVILGGLLGDRLGQRGGRNARMQVGLICAIGSLVPTVGFVLVQGEVATMAVLAVATLFLSMQSSAGPAALQEVVPNQLRGQVAALYVFTVTLIGLGLGPTVMALVLDHVFGYDQAVGMAVAIVAAVALPLAGVLFWLGMAPFARSRDDLARAVGSGAPAASPA
ncbi:spinster family MFS transporter [Zavarzinia sp. CC-PAN008]|uniref:spinster family MFS transporter n=1 Tax=Zavarzinia sp. CC-PAN008 TaxID=3243332 RepID=UPI003F747145